MAKRNSEYEMAIKIAGEIEKSFYESTKLTKKELSDLARHAAKTATAASASSVSGAEKIRKELGNAAPAFQNLERISDVTFGAIKTAAVAAATGVAAVTTASMTVGENFEEQMSIVQSISMAENEEMDRLNKKAKELGESTKFSATEVGQGFEYMAMAGWKTKDMLAGIDGVLSLAAASGEDMGQVSDIVTDAMTAFGLGADQVGRFADVLAVAASNSNTNVSMMGETFRYVAPVAGALGYTVEDTALAIGLMANSGIKASQAGTALRSMMSRLTKPTKEVNTAMDRLGVSLTDKNGEMKSFMQLQKDIRKGFQGMTESQAAETAAMLAGQEAMSGLLAIANASDEDFEKLAAAIGDSAGAAEKMANIRIDNLKGDMTILQSAAEGFGIELFENFSGTAREAVQGATEVVGSLTETMSKKFPTVRREVRQLAGDLGEMADPILSLGEWLIDHPGAIAGPIAGIGTAVTTYKAATGLMSLAGAMTAMGPAGWTIMGIGGVTAVLAGIGVQVKKSADAAKKANLDAHFGDIALSLKEVQSIASGVVKNRNLEKIRESISAMEELEGVADSVADAKESLDKINWKVSVGIELTDQEKQEYQEHVEGFVKATQEYITQRQYAVSLSVGTLVQDDLEGSNIVDQVNQFYAGKQKELSDLGTQLNETITEAFQDGLLDIDEVEEISKLQQQIANIKSQLAESNFEAGLDLIGTKYTGMELDADSFQNVQAEIQDQMKEAMAEYDEAYKTSMSQFRTMRSAGEWSQEEFDAAAESAQRGYLQQKAEAQARAAQFQMEIIRKAYGDELGGLVEQLQGEAQEELGRMLSGVASGAAPNVHMDLLGENITSASKKNVDRTTRDALGDLYTQLEPALKEMRHLQEQYREAGEKIPEALAESIAEVSAIGGLSGNVEAMWGVIEQEASSEEYQMMLQGIQDEGGYIPEQLATAISDNQYQIDEAVKQSYADTQRMISDTFRNPFGVPISFTGAKGPYSETYMKNSVKEGHAEGGIFNTPHIAWFAEKGPEAAIPLDGSRNAIDLWTRTGELLGMDSLLNGGAGGVEGELYSDQEVKIEYSPTLQFYGAAPSEKDVEEALETEQEKFAQMMDQYLKNNRRVSFW